MHSGWGAFVALSGNADTPEVIDRRRLVITEPKVPGARQPYHFAQKLGFPEAEKYLANCAAVSQRLALAAVRDAMEELHARNYRVVGSAILLASGRPLPSLSEILASHALIHTAEGEFFRRAVWEACERLQIRVTGVRERELDEQTKAAFGRAAARIQQRIGTLGRSLGPPWTQDQKSAALAALLVLAGKSVSA